MSRQSAYESSDSRHLEEALKLGQNEQVKIDLLFTDVIMPGISGRELAEAFRALRQSIKILFQSGYRDDFVVRHGILQTEVPFLQKPFSIDALAKKIRNLFDQRDPLAECCG